MRRVTTLVFTGITRLSPAPAPARRFASSSSIDDPVNLIVNLRASSNGSSLDFKTSLDKSSLSPSPDVTLEILSRLRHDWESAFTFFLWAGNHHPHSAREYHSMISILGKMRKFDTAWGLIHEMRKTDESIMTRQTLLLMIRKYCAAHDVARAIHTFYAYKKFGFEASMDDFHGLLSALTRYKNVAEAEHLLFCNSDVFPFNSKSFNIVLNGWANIVGSLRNAERIWAEMGNRGVAHDAVSYSCLISCHSKSSKLNKVLRIYGRMKSLGVEPDTKVYNALIYALGKVGYLNEATKLMRTMGVKGLAPTIVTYNSMIKTLCKAGEIEQAEHVLREMMEEKRGVVPTVQTYHPFLRVVKTGEQAFELLEKMKSTGCTPNTDTYIMLIRKFCRWRDLDNVFKLWREMSENGAGPDRSSYIVLIHGLFLNRKLEEAHKYYKEMIDRNYLPEPKTEEMLQAWLSGKQQTSTLQTTNGELGLEDYIQPAMKSKLVINKKSAAEKDYCRQPEIRRVVRARGFSYWDQ